MAISTQQALTADEFWELPESPGKWLELVDGKVVEVPGSGVAHAVLLLHVFDLLRAFISANALGEIYPDGLTYRLNRNPDVLRIPDISFIAADRIPSDWPPVGYSDLVPDLVVEIVSPSNSALDLRRRTQDYLRAGVSQVWIVWPEDQSVSVYFGDTELHEYRSNDMVDGGDLLPGFALAVNELLDAGA